MRARQRRAPRGVVAHVVVAGLLGSGLVASGLAGGSASAATPSAAPGPETPARPSAGALLSGGGAAAVRAAGLLDDLPPLRPAATRAATTTAGYADTCHDTQDSPLDLRELALSEDSSTGTFVLTVTSCRPWSAADLGADGFLEIPLSVGTADGADHLVLVTADEGGELRLTVLDTPRDGAARTTHSGAMSPSTDGYAARGAFPRTALEHPETGRCTAGSSPCEFVFVGRSVDGQGREDLLPEAYADALAYPFSCSLQVQRAATLVVDPPAAGRLSAFARQAGAAVRPAAPAVLALEDVSDTALQALRREPGVRSAQRAVVYRKARVPNDPAYPQQWHLPEIDAPAAWDVRTGSGLLLAVVDDGVDGRRPELAARVRAGGRDTVYDQPLPVDSDLGGHGTAVAGLAAAQTDNGSDVAAVDWDASVLPLRVFDAAGCASDGAVVDALYAAADAGASVANLSLGGPGDSPLLRQAVRDVTARGMLVVAASGNSRGVDDAPNYPAAYPEVLAVGATTRGGQLAAYSSGGDHVDVTAPGGDGSGTAEGDLLVLGERGALQPQAGTSFSAPLVSASALLLRAAKPGLSPGQVVEAVERSAVDAGRPGRDPDYGAGRLDLRALLGTPTPSARATTQACPPDRVPRGRFADVPPDSTHAATVDCVAWWRVAEGRGNGYAPVEPVTRAQMATFIARLIERSGGELPASPPDAFSDDAGNVHELRINQLAALGIVAGRGNGVYAPGEPVNRGQMATFLVRGYERRSGQALASGGDYFADDDGTTHEPRIDQAAQAGFTGGLAGGGYGPDLPVRRDAMASFLARVLDRLVEEGRTTPPGV